MDFAEPRHRMVQEQLARRGIRDPGVLDAMGGVPRERFVAETLAEAAYDDCPQPIGEGQTISQPFMVALMTELLALKGGERILEIGTGSGYQTAVLATLGCEVYSVERLPSLAAAARALLTELGFAEVHYRVGDGTLGWPDHAPYQGIVVAAGAPAVPLALRGQLADGGRLVIPVGSQSSQDLVVVTRHGGRFDEQTVTSCVFVKLIGDEGWRSR